MTGSESWLDIAARLGALVDAEGRTLPATITRDGTDHVLVGCDLGNSAIKLVLRQADAPQLRMFRFDAVYTPAVTIRAGQGATAQRVLRNAVWGEWFWPDHEHATTGETLPIGATAERLADPRLLDVLIGTLVAALERSGRPPGAYTLWIGLGIPNEEVSALDARAAAAQRTPGSYLIAPASIASTANAVGLFALTLYVDHAVNDALDAFGVGALGDA